jgi:hypothetical protein
MAAATKIAAVWKGQKARKNFRTAVNTAKALKAMANRKKALAAAPSSGTRRNQVLLENLFSKWTNAPGKTLEEKMRAVGKARRGAPPTGLGFRQLHDFFMTKGLGPGEADAVALAFFNNGPTLIKLVNRWKNIKNGTSVPSGPVNTTGKLTGSNLKNYLTIVNERNKQNANRIARFYGL